MLLALCMTSCSVSRKTAESSVERRVESVEVRDSVELERVAERDSVKEVTVITIDRNEAGDTVRVAQVTERERVRNRDAIAVQRTKKEVVRDTVYIERKDSLQVTAYSLKGDSPVSSKQSAVSATLKWIFFIIVGLSALILIVKLKI